MTEHQLRWWYGRFNTLYFDGKLPKPIYIYFSTALSNKAMAIMHHLWDDDGIFKHIIRINTRLKWARSATLLAVLHEMIHVKLSYSRTPHNCLKPKGPFADETYRLLKKRAFNRWL